MAMSEEQMRRVEERIPELGRQAVARAVAKARSSGHTVTVGIEGDLFEIHPDGTRTFLKKLPPQVAVDRTRRLRIR